MLHTSPSRHPVTRPLIFLAGPIQGASDWHTRAIAYITEKAPDCDIASPRRPVHSMEDFGEAMYIEQVDWEHDHLAISAKTGSILFWLAAQGHEVEGRSYAQTTRFELGEAVTMQRYGEAQVTLGIEDGFSNARYIRYTVAKKNPGIPLCATLEETCDRAIEQARNRAKS